jgi:hypothetical protein
MKRIFGICLLVFAFTFVTQTATARGVIFYSNGLTYEINQELPEDIEIDSSHVDFGISYEQFSIFWIPLWNYGTTTYAFIDKSNKTVYDITAEDAEFIKDEFDIDTNIAPKISFWNAIGGKLLAGAVIILVLVWSRISKKKEKEQETQETNSL